MKYGSFGADNGTLEPMLQFFVMRSSQRGFAWLPILILLGLIVVGGGTYFVMHQNVNPQTLQNYPDISATQPPAITFMALPTSIKSGGSATLSWSSPAAAYCTGTGFSTGSLAAGNNQSQSSITVSPQTTTYYSITCGNAGGTTSKTVTVSVEKSTQESAVSVPGMSEYTDTDFGFSLWYPSGWSVFTHSNSAVNTYPNGSYDGIISIRSNANPPHLLTIQKVTANDMTYRVSPGACGYCGPVNYFFDPTQHLWMKQYPMGPNGAPDATQEQIAQYKIAKPADISQNTMGGLHVFSTEQKESAAIIPLSARHFLLVTDNTYTEMCGSGCASPDVKGGAAYLANTIVATDPSAATAASPAQQTATIQAEQQAYAGQ